MSKNGILSNPLPHSVETERAVIGALLVESGAIGEVVGILTQDVFYDGKLGKIYRAISGLYDRNVKPDMVTVARELISSGDLDEVGGAIALSELSAGMASGANIVDHSRYLHQLWIARRLAVAGMEITARASDPSNDIDDTLAQSLGDIEAIAVNTAYGSRMSVISSVARDCLENYQNRKERARNGQIQGVSTGLRKLDRLTTGWRGGQLIILAARPAMGKTSFLLHLAKSAAMGGTPVVIFSLEMSGSSLGDRLILSECDVNGDEYKAGTLPEAGESAICGAIDRISSLPISVDDTPNISMQQIKARARNLNRQGKCGIVLIDYLQLIDMRSGNKSYNREQEVSQCSRAAKIMAKELDIPVVMLSQLSRKNEERSDKMPMLSDLRESGAIEQDADIVMFIHRPEYYDKNAEKGYGELRIAKQRDGATGDIRFRYNNSLTKIFDYELQMPF